MLKAFSFTLVERRSYTVAIILLLSEIIPSYSYYTKEGLVYVVITLPIN